MCLPFQHTKYFLAALLAPASPETAGERPRYKSPLGLAVDPTGRFAYVALHTANALAVVDLRERRVVCEIPVGKKPHDVALHKGIAYVTCEADDTLVRLVRRKTWSSELLIGWLQRSSRARTMVLMSIFGRLESL